MYSTFFSYRSSEKIEKTLRTNWKNVVENDNISTNEKLRDGWLGVKKENFKMTIISVKYTLLFYVLEILLIK